MIKLPYILILLSYFSVVFGTVDFIIFSFDRPLQLYALLESSEKYIKGLGETHVIFRVSDSRYSVAYHELEQRFNWVVFSKQKNKNDFKQLTLEKIENSSNRYVMFGVDDLIVKDYIDLVQCAQLLENKIYYAFYLRLGLNIDRSYPSRQLFEQPNFNKIQEDIYSWSLKEGVNYWNYPNTVDMAVYRKEDLIIDLKEINFTQPNELEANWVGRAFYRGLYQIGLCSAVSQVVNIPINRVQDVFKNHNMNFLSPHELLDLFLKGKKIDVDGFYGLNNRCPHWDYEPHFISR